MTDAPGEIPIAATSAPGAPQLSAIYQQALEEGACDEGESALRRAYEIGRKGIAEGTGLLEMATMHHEALAHLLGRITRSARVQREVRRAGAFFAESLSPYEMAQRGFSEAVVALRRLNELPVDAEDLGGHDVPLTRQRSRLVLADHLQLVGRGVPARARPVQDLHRR